MTEQRKQPSHSDQHEQAQRQRFEQELAQFQKHAATPAGAQAFPSAGSILSVILQLLQEGGIKDQLFELWLKLKGGTDNPAPPPEPAS